MSVVLYLAVVYVFGGLACAFTVAAWMLAHAGGAGSEDAETQAAWAEADAEIAAQGRLLVLAKVAVGWPWFLASTVRGMR